MPLEILRGLHRIQHDSPVLNGLPAVAEAIRIRRPPTVRFEARNFFGLLSGTVHFAQLTFRTQQRRLRALDGGHEPDVQYVQHAVVPISEYTAQYGTNAVTVASQLLTKTVTLSGTSFSDGELQGWVNELARDNHFFSADCIFVVVPQGSRRPVLEQTGVTTIGRPFLT